MGIKHAQPEKKFSAQCAIAPSEQNFTKRLIITDSCELNTALYANTNILNIWCNNVNKKKTKGFKPTVLAEEKS